MRRRLLACISLTLIMVLGSEMRANVANAGLNSITINGSSQTVGTGTWKAVAQSALTPIGSSAFINSDITGSNSATNTGTLFYVINTGSLNLDSVGFSLTSTTNKNAAYTINIHSCSGTWNAGTGACSVVATQLYTVTINSPAPASSVSIGTLGVPLSSPTGSSRLRIQYIGGSSPKIGVTFNTKISAPNARAATNEDL